MKDLNYLSIGLLITSVCLGGTACLDAEELITTQHGITVTAFYGVERDERFKHRIAHLTENISPYTQTLLQEWASESLDTNQLEVVVVDAKDRYQGQWLYPSIPNRIAVNAHSPNHLNVYGHELARWVLYKNGARKEATQSSLSWSGLIGMMWNDAENIGNHQFPLLAEHK